MRGSERFRPLSGLSQSGLTNGGEDIKTFAKFERTNKMSQNIAELKQEFAAKLAAAKKAPAILCKNDVVPREEYDKVVEALNSATELNRKLSNLLQSNRQTTLTTESNNE